MQRPVTVGVLGPVIGGFYFGAIINGVNRMVAGVNGRLVAIQTLQAGCDRDERVGEPEFSVPVAMDEITGYVCVASAVRREYLDRLRAAGKPIVLITRSVEGIPAPVVAPDNRGGVRAAVEHLLSHGHRRIAFVGNLVQRDMRERYEAYRQTLRDNGIAPDPALFFEAVNNVIAGGRVAGGRLLAAGLPSTAVLAATDQNAVGLLEVLAAAGVRVPEEQAVVGFDDTEFAQRTDPPLASVNQQIEGLGELAGRLLLARIGGVEVEPREYRSPASFVPRDSCGCTRRMAWAGSPASGACLASDARVASDVRVASGASGAGPASDQDAMAAGAARLRRLALALSEELLTDPADGTDLAAVTVQADALATVYAMVLRDGTPADPVRLCEIAEALWALNHRHCDVRALMKAVTGYLGELLSTRPGRDAERLLHEAVLHTGLALAEAHAEAQAERVGVLEGALGAQFEIDMELLRRGEGDPRDLTWMPESPLALATCFAMWNGHAGVDGDRQLRIVGAHDAAGALRELVGTSMGVRRFPPAEMIRRADPRRAEIVYATPVRVDPSDWGMLAILGPIQVDGGWGRDRFNHWAALLAVALDQEELLASLRRQRANLARSYERERALAESVRASEERYALAARAANDGLWDWNVNDGTIYYSSRWRAMLGCTDEEIGDSPEEWFARVHPEDKGHLDAAIEKLLEGSLATLEHQHRLRTAADDYRWVLCRALAVRDGDGRATRIVGSLTDVTERTRLEEKLRERALLDQVTGLPNRSFFQDLLSASISRTHRYPDHHFAVLFLDLDGFKVINDSLGHAIGDRVLVGVAERLRACLRAADTAARFGGDEFAVLLDEAQAEDVPEIVARLQETLRAPFRIDDHEVVVSASIGVALSATGYHDAADVLRDADIAMYRSKARERGTYTVFDLAMRAGALQRMRTEVELRSALEAGRLRLYYQPIVELATGRVVALEALLRWAHPTRGVVGPAEFLAIAEETGLIVPVGHWVIEQVCRDISGWRKDHGAGRLAAGLRVSVNVSNRQFWHGALLSHLTDALARAEVPPRCLTIEITEGVIMHNPDLALRTLQQLREYGLALQIDDFGTGYSSFGSVRRFPIQGVKIDRSFVAVLGDDERDNELVNTILMMGRSLGLDVIAEGVETRHQAEVLRDLGCKYAQGYYHAAPLPSARIPVLLVEPASLEAGVG